MAVVPSPGTDSRLKSVTLSRSGKTLLKDVSDTTTVPSEPRVAAVTGAAIALSPIWTTSASAGRRTASPPSDWPPFPEPSLSSAVASFGGAACTATEDVALVVPDWSTRRDWPDTVSTVHVNPVNAATGVEVFFGTNAATAACIAVATSASTVEAAAAAGNVTT